jgi:uncharacterized phage protein (TIGR01671 family)
MRTIKFRAWDGFKMNDVLSLSFNNKSIIRSNVDPVFGIGLTYMQFTGLLDKGGKEIYEGDVIERKGIIGQVIYKKAAGAFWLVWEQLEKGRTVSMYQELSATFSDGNIYRIDHYEIIGNIHQNPEFLNQNKQS